MNDLMKELRRSSAEITALWPEWKRKMTTRAADNGGEWVDDPRDVDLAVEVIDKEIDRLQRRKEELLLVKKTWKIEVDR